MKAPAERRLPQFCGFWSELEERSCWSWPDSASCGNWLQTKKIHRSLKGALKPGEWIKSAKKHLILVHNQSWRWERRDVASNETHFKSESCTFTFTFLPPNSWLLLYRALSFPFSPILCHLPLFLSSLSSPFANFLFRLILICHWKIPWVWLDDSSKALTSLLHNTT